MGETHRVQDAAERRQLRLDAFLLLHKLYHRQLRQVARGAPGRWSGGDSWGMNVVVHGNAHSRRWGRSELRGIEGRWGLLAFYISTTWRGDYTNYKASTFASYTVLRLDVTSAG